MTRLEALELVYRNAPNRDNAKHHSVIKSAIGEDFCGYILCYHLYPVKNKRYERRL